MNAIEINGLCRKYPRFTLGPLDLTLPSGCIMGLIGENGAGKSTTIRLILDIIARDGGTVRLLGKENRENMQLLKDEIGVVLDEVGIPEALNANQTGKVMSGIFRRWDGDAFERYLDMFSIERNKKFKDYSRGMRMKLGIAVALSHGAKLLILDEATSGLDPIMRDEITGLLNEFTRDEEHSVLISSHILSDLEKICDYIAMMHKGKLLLCDEKDRLKEKYGILHVTADDFRNIPKNAVIGRHETPYGVEAVVLRDAVPRGSEVGNIDLEQLFLVMTKEAV